MAQEGQRLVKGMAKLIVIQTGRECSFQGNKGFFDAQLKGFKRHGDFRALVECDDDSLYAGLWELMDDDTMASVDAFIEKWGRGRNLTILEHV